MGGWSKYVDWFIPRLAFGGGGGATPQAPATPTPLVPPPLLQSPQGATATEDVRKRAAASFGGLGTIATSPSGVLIPPNLAQKQLLGS